MKSGEECWYAVEAPSEWCYVGQPDAAGETFEDDDDDTDTDADAEFDLIDTEWLDAIFIRPRHWRKDYRRVHKVPNCEPRSTSNSRWTNAKPIFQPGKEKAILNRFVPPRRDTHLQQRRGGAGWTNCRRQ
jgi:hypothetical protein